MQLRKCRTGKAVLGKFNLHVMRNEGYPMRAGYDLRVASLEFPLGRGDAGRELAVEES